MPTVMSIKNTLDIKFNTSNDGSYTWKLNDPSTNITTLTQIKNHFGFDNAGNPSSGTGLFGSLYQDGLRLYDSNNRELKSIESAQKVSTVITKEDMPD